MENNPKKPWYLRWWTVLAALITIGPFAFPLLWQSKDFNLFWKWFLTLIFVAITVLAIWASWATVKFVIQTMKDYGLL